MKKTNHFPYLRLVFLAAIIGLVIGFGAILLHSGTQNAAASRQPLTLGAITQAETQPFVLNSNATTEDALGFMLGSYTKWQTIAGQATIIVNLPDGKTETFFEEFQFSQPAKGMVKSGIAGQMPKEIWVSDGHTIWRENFGKAIYMSEAVPSEVLAPDSFGPEFMPEGVNQFVVPHPMSGIVPALSAQYLFPQAIAQSHVDWHSEIIGQENIANHESLIILFQFLDGNTILKQHKFWIDMKTGVILKSQIFSADSGWDDWQMEITVDELKYDELTPSQAFVYRPTLNAQYVSPEEFLTISFNQ